MNAQSTVRLGVVGLGGWGSFHAARMEGTDATLVGGIDIDPAARERFEERFGVPTHENLDELNETGVDGVIITTPNQYHEEQAVAAFEAGLDVLIEKPLAHTLDSAERIVAAAANAPGICMVGSTRRAGASNATSQSSGNTSPSRRPARTEVRSRHTRTPTCGRSVRPQSSTSAARRTARSTSGPVPPADSDTSPIPVGRGERRVRASNGSQRPTTSFGRSSRGRTRDCTSSHTPVAGPVVHWNSPVGWRGTSVPNPRSSPSGSSTGSYRPSAHRPRRLLVRRSTVRSVVRRSDHSTGSSDRPTIGFPTSPTERRTDLLRTGSSTEPPAGYPTRPRRRPAPIADRTSLSSRLATDSLPVLSLEILNYPSVYVLLNGRSTSGRIDR